MKIEIKIPEENEMFKVNPLRINRNIFQEARKEPREEEIRRLILEAFKMMDIYPKRYKKSFYTFFPNKGLKKTSMDEILKFGLTFGDEVADWVYQVLEWAQILQNEQAWKIMLNEPDNSTYYRLVVWKDECYVAIGGSKQHALEAIGIYVQPKISICGINPSNSSRLVPLVVNYLN